MPKAGCVKTVLIRPYGITLKLYRDLDAMARAVTRGSEAYEEFRDTWDYSAGLTCDGPGLVIYVGVFEGGKATLVHELVHAGLYALARVNISPTSNSGEPLAYLVDDLYQQLEKYV